MSKLISGKEALIAIGKGKEIEYKFNDSNGWMPQNCLTIDGYLNNVAIFRLKPRTITINGIEVPAPFEPKDGEDCRAYVIDTGNVNGYDWQHSSHYKSGYIVWRTEAEIKQVVEALRSVFKPQ